LMQVRTIRDGRATEIYFGALSSGTAAGCLNGTGTVLLGSLHDLEITIYRQV
jgi:hypothetical protein